jgi:hypothetical protein
MAYGSEDDENVRLKHKQKIYILKLKIYVHYYNVFTLQRSFLKLQISHP